MAEIDIDVEEWFNSASNYEKQEMYDLLIADGYDEEDVSVVEEMLQSNHFLKQNVLLALKQFNDKANITAMSDLIREIEDL